MDKLLSHKTFYYLWPIHMLLLLAFPSILAAQETLTLQQCRNLALEHNKEIAIAEENTLAVHELEKAAQTLYYPKFSFHGGYFRMNKQFSLFSKNMFLPVVPSEVYQNGLSTLDPRENPDLVRETMVTQNFNGVPIPVEDPKTGKPMFQDYALLPKSEARFDLENIFFGNIGLRQPVYTGGKIKQTQKIARYSKKLMEARKQVSKADVVMQTDKRYWKVISLQEKVKLSKDYLKRLDALLSDVSNLHEEGIVTRNKLMQVQVKKNKVELQKFKAENGLKLARMALNQKLGYPLDTLFLLADSLGSTKSLSHPGEYKAKALENRSEIRALRQSINITESGVEIMKSRYLPNIGLAANYTFTNPNPWNGFDNEFGGSPNIGLYINVPIYHWGERKHTLQAVKHKQKADIKKLEQTRELISLEVRKAIFSYNESVKQVNMTQTGLEQARENLEITKDNFEEGMAKSADVLEAQSIWQEAYNDHINAMIEYKLNRTKLLQTSGQLLKTVKE